MVYRRRRTIRKRPKRYTRRRSMMRAPRSNYRADSTYSEKLTYETELYVQGNHATFSAHWARSDNSAATELFPVGGSTGNKLFDQCATMFRAYKITGMKLEYRPYFVNQNSADIILKSVTVGTMMDIEGAIGVPVPINDFRASLDAKQYDPQKPFKRYYHISRWAKGREINWRTTEAAQGNVYGNATPDCMTNFDMETVGVADGTLIAAVRITYYVKFKERRAD